MSDAFLLTLAALLVGLCVGSFLNVVIHRLPKMLERGWQAQCAELRGEAPAAEPAYNLVVPRSACPACGHRITRAAEHPDRLLARAARPVRDVQGADLGRATRWSSCWAGSSPAARSGASA